LISIKPVIAAVAPALFGIGNAHATAVAPPSCGLLDAGIAVVGSALNEVSIRKKLK